MVYLVKILPLIIGSLLDATVGDPAWLPHPISGFGRAISFFEKKLNHGSHLFLKGAFTAIFLIGATFTLTFFILKYLGGHLWIKLALESILVFFALSARTLIVEVRQVFIAVEKSLDDGRKQVARIVGRDTQNLSAQEIRTAALETLSENLSDGVIAPIFWFLILGVPGIITYKMINTLDSMIGYRNEKYFLFGKFAARTDDVANFIPARITAFLMILSSGRISLLRFVSKYGRAHASPNSGYPEAALAGILDCRFGGPHDYFGQNVYKPYIGDNPRDITSDDLDKSIRINILSEVLMIFFTLATILIV